MTPFVTMRQVLKSLLAGRSPEARLECSNCPGPDCRFCAGKGTVVLSPLGDESPSWQEEAALLLQGSVPMALQTPVLRQTVSPMIQAERVVMDDQRGMRRFQEARNVLDRCQAADWRAICVNWIDEYERRAASV